MKTKSLFSSILLSILTFSAIGSGAAMLCHRTHSTGLSGEQISTRIEALIAEQIRVQQYNFSDPALFNQSRAYVENEKKFLALVVPDFDRTYQDRYLVLRDELKQKQKSRQAQKQIEKQTRADIITRTTAFSPEKFLEIPHQYEVDSAILSPSGRYIFSGSHKLPAQIIDAASGRVLHSIPLAGPKDNIIFSPDEKFVLFTDMRVAKVIDVASGEVREFKYTRLLRKGLFSPDGKSLALIANDANIIFYDIFSGEELRKVQIPSVIQNAKYSRTGKTMAVGIEETTTLIVEVATGRIRRTIENTNFPRKEFHSPDGMLYYTDYPHRSAIAIVDVAKGKPRFEVQHSGRIKDRAFSPDGKLFVTASEDSTAKVVDTATGDVLFTIEHDGAVNSVAFSPDGNTVLTASSDTTVRLTKLYVNLKDEKL